MRLLRRAPAHTAFLLRLAAVVNTDDEIDSKNSNGCEVSYDPNNIPKVVVLVIIVIARIKMMRL